MTRKKSRKRKSARTATATPQRSRTRAVLKGGDKPVAAGRRKTHASLPAKPAGVVDALVAANAQALGLSLDPAWRGAVKFNLQLILRLAALIDEFPLPDDIEPAPVFHA